MAIQTTTQLFTTIGSGSFAKPAGVTSITVECWGGGATGGDGDSVSGGCGGTGGGGGGYARSTLLYSASAQTINYVVAGRGVLLSSWWDDVGGPATEIGPYDTPTTVYYRVRGAGGAQRNTVGSCFEFGGPGGGQPTGTQYNPNVGDVTYNGGDGARSGATGGGGGGGAGSTGQGNSPSGGQGTAGSTGGSPTSEFGGAGGTGGIGATNPTSGSVYGGGGGGGKPGFGNTGELGGQGLIRITYSVEPLIPKIVWNGNTIVFGYALDNVTSYSTNIDGSQTVRTENGTEYSWIPNNNYILECDVRWIPTTNGTNPTQTGWDGATGWRAFLEYARAKNPFSFFLASTDGSGISSYLVDPLDGQHELEPDGTRRIRLVIRNTTTAYTGF